MTRPLTTIEEVENLLGRNIDQSEHAHVNALIKRASQLFCEHAKTDFQPVTTTLRLKCDSGRVLLPRGASKPIKVTYENQAPARFTYIPGSIDLPYDYMGTVLVTLTMWETVPELVTSQIAEMVMKVLNVSPEAKAGLTQKQETIGPFTETGTFATWAVGGQLMMSPEDKRVAELYRTPRSGHTWLMRL